MHHQGFFFCFDAGRHPLSFNGSLLQLILLGSRPAPPGLSPATAKISLSRLIFMCEEESPSLLRDVFALASGKRCRQLPTAWLSFSLSQPRLKNHLPISILLFLYFLFWLGWFPTRCVDDRGMVLFLSELLFVWHFTWFPLPVSDFSLSFSIPFCSPCWPFPMFLRCKNVKLLLRVSDGEKMGSGR